jgi:hypothetical protein
MTILVTFTTRVFPIFGARSGQFDIFPTESRHLSVRQDPSFGTTYRFVSELRSEEECRGCTYVTLPAKRDRPIKTLHFVKQSCFVRQTRIELQLCYAREMLMQTTHNSRYLLSLPCIAHDSSRRARK